MFSEVLYTCELPGQPTTLQLFYNDGGEDGDQVIVENTKLKFNGVPKSYQMCGLNQIILTLNIQRVY